MRLVALLLASGVPFAAYLATASAHDFWLDGGEVTAQGIFLDIAHPPGHPLAGLVAKLLLSRAAAPEASAAELEAQANALAVVA